MLPELGQCAVTTSPVLSWTSAMNRLYLLIRIPGNSLGQARPIEFVESLELYIKIIEEIFSGKYRADCTTPDITQCKGR